MLRPLRIFRELVTTQSFTEAAQQNFLTQSAVSHHLKALEEKFGQQLVERSRGKVRLTRAGLLLFEAGQDLLKRYEELEQALKNPTSDIRRPAENRKYLYHKAFMSCPSIRASSSSATRRSICCSRT